MKNKKKENEQKRTYNNIFLFSACQSCGGEMKNEKYCEEVIRTIEKWSFKTEKLGFTFSDDFFPSKYSQQVYHLLKT